MEYKQEEISTNEKFCVEYERYAHKVHFVFVCRLASEAIQPTAKRDLDMVESVWVNIDDMCNIPLYPQIINERLGSILKSDSILYLGSEQV